MNISEYHDLEQNDNTTLSAFFYVIQAIIMSNMIKMNMQAQNPTPKLIRPKLISLFNSKSLI